MDLAERLKTLRRHFKISQSDIGDILSVRQQAVSHYEKSGNIDAAKLEVLADHFGLDIKFFLRKSASGVLSQLQQTDSPPAFLGQRRLCPRWVGTSFRENMRSEAHAYKKY